MVRLYNAHLHELLKIDILHCPLLALLSVFRATKTSTVIILYAH